ncbi:hypothetical protein [Streptomyces sp. NBC_01500]|uniref:hypothetical protein n=1 Tax=Streptomyces sp. NBC_01500 TaxID=2903886 RepID=UPI0022513CC8|nr:hypothetical protein [Streptomyces sp. NBC_01500]MCX4553505.1 hypothetical protein [Streptomyces sp. NBC_01500]
MTTRTRETLRVGPDPMFPGPETQVDGRHPLPVPGDFCHAHFPKSPELFHHLTHLGDQTLAA